MEYIRISEETRDMVNQFLMKHWYSTKMAVRGKVYDLSEADGILVREGQEIKGLVTWIFYEDICEIMSLDSLKPGIGIGTELLEQVICLAKQENCRRIVLITTNDNMNAMQFYQKRGFDMVKLHWNALEVSRKLKPEIPMTGDNGIPLRHELEFEMLLS